MNRINHLLIQLRIWKDTKGQDLIEYALMAGFVAVAAGAVASTGNSVIVAGHFVNAASATGSLRPAVGYRAGKKIETRIQLVQGGRLLSELEINAGSEDSTVGIPDIARQVAEVVVQAYINRGWLPPPHK